MVRAIVFDLGGVLFAEGKSVAVEKLAREHGYKKDIVLEVLSSSKSMALRKGLISDEEFWGWAQRQIPDGYDALLIKKEWYEGYVLDEDILGLIKRLVEIMIEESGCLPREIVYIEDNDRYALPARELGVHVVIYSRGEVRKLAQELQKLGVKL